MKLGAMSISLAVKDINKSKAFYEKLGYRLVAPKSQGMTKKLIPIKE